VEQGPSLLAAKTAKLAIRAGVSVVALLVLRGVVGSLPVLRNSAAISDSFLGDTLLSPLVIANAIIDTAILVVILTIGIRLGQIIRGHVERFAELGTIATQSTLVIVLILAYKMYELPAACFFVGRTELVNLNTNNASGSYSDFIRVWGQLISQVNATVIQNASGEALTAYQQLALAVFRRPPNYYAWSFLILIAIPVIGLVPLVHRNLDSMTDLLSHSAATLQGNALRANEAGPTVANHAVSAAASPAAARPGDTAAMPLKLIVDKLVKLKMLVDAQAISAADFENQKQRVLAVPIRPDANSADPDDFIRLKAMFESGALTEVEYETQKQRALQQI
jgi:hypothetical protein